MTSEPGEVMRDRPADAGTTRLRMLGHEEQCRSQEQLGFGQICLCARHAGLRSLAAALGWNKKAFGCGEPDSLFGGSLRKPEGLLAGWSSSGDEVATVIGVTTHAVPSATE
jgi:hypothetical protein